MTIFLTYFQLELLMQDLVSNALVAFWHIWFGLIVSISLDLQGFGCQSRDCVGHKTVEPIHCLGPMSGSDSWNFLRLLF